MLLRSNIRYILLSLQKSQESRGPTCMSSSSSGLFSPSCWWFCCCCWWDCFTVGNSELHTNNSNLYTSNRLMNHQHRVSACLVITIHRQQVKIHLRPSPALFYILMFFKCYNSLSLVFSFSVLRVQSCSSCLTFSHSDKV